MALEENKISHELVGVLTIKNKDNEILAIVANDMKKRSQIFYTCKEMGVDDIKNLLDLYKE